LYVSGETGFNDMSEINIEAQLVDRENALNRTEEKLVEMTNGCICCTLREGLLQEVSKLARKNGFGYLIELCSANRLSRTGLRYS
jgi:G3E family GTPase